MNPLRMELRLDRLVPARFGALGPRVRVRDPDGRELDVPPGGIIGRMETAACRIAHPSISGAHALIRLRERRLWMLALRGRLLFDGCDRDEIELGEGMKIQLSPAITLVVVGIHLPLEALGMRLNGGTPQLLCAAGYSLVQGHSSELIPRLMPGALAYLWQSADRWFIKTTTDPAEPALPGQSWQVRGQVLEAVAMPLAEAGTGDTLSARRGPPPLVIVVRYATVHIHRPGHQAVLLSGLPAKLLTEVAQMAAPSPWQVVAGQLWSAETNRDRLRHKWDRVLCRLRAKLAEGKVRDNLLRSDGAGNFELVLLPGDRVVDQS